MNKHKKKGHENKGLIAGDTGQSPALSPGERLLPGCQHDAGQTHCEKTGGHVNEGGSENCPEIKSGEYGMELHRRPH